MGSEKHKKYLIQVTFGSPMTSSLGSHVITRVKCIGANSQYKRGPVKFAFLN